MDVQVLLDRLRTIDLRLGPVTVTRQGSVPRSYFSTGPYVSACAATTATPTTPLP